MDYQAENRQAEFAVIIKKLKRRRAITVSLFAAAVALILIFTTPSEIYITGVIDQVNKGLPGWLTGILLVVALFIFLIAYGYTILPIDKALDEECDPEKYLALYTALGSKQVTDPNRQAALYTAFFYMGRYVDAISHAQQLTTHKKPLLRAAGHFFMAQCGYFMGDAMLLREAALRYRAELAMIPKMNDKNRALFDCRTAMLTVMEGLCDGNHAAVEGALPHMRAWSSVPAVTILIDTLKGIAALPRPDGGGDRDEAVHRFITVKEKGGRTCFVAMAEWYLGQLKGGALS
ncbi:MAG: hypothetical protein E7661_06405 [Ruminococcaceae bacterium]|nr:hypothetical protein [Oscillospiraceae bacterium]